MRGSLKVLQFLKKHTSWQRCPFMYLFIAVKINLVLFHSAYINIFTCSTSYVVILSKRQKHIKIRLLVDVGQFVVVLYQILCRVGIEDSSYSYRRHINVSESKFCTGC